MTSLLPHHKLTYFDAAGFRGEICRILLYAAGVHFEDYRFPSKDWAALKPNTPLGFVPTLQVGDKTYCQSGALARYAARLAGMYPEDPLEALVVDEAIETLGELVAKFPQGGTPEEKKAKREEYQSTTMTQYGKFLEGRIEECGNGSSFVKSGTCLADVVLLVIVQLFQSGRWDYIDANFFFDRFPHIAATCQATLDHPKVKAYYESSNKEDSVGGKGA